MARNSLSIHTTGKAMNRRSAPGPMTFNTDWVRTSMVRLHEVGEIVDRVGKRGEIEIQQIARCLSHARVSTFAMCAVCLCTGTPRS